MSNNYPDDCQGNDPNLPWNEPEPIECPKCLSSMTREDIYYICDDEQCEYVMNVFEE